MSKYYEIQSHIQNQFYQFPKFLMEIEPYRSLSPNTKLLYMVLRDRNELSILNGWVDEKGRIFFYADQEKMMELLNIKGKDTIAKCFKELKKCELLESVRQGQGKPNINYLLLPQIGMNTLKYENHTSSSMKIIPLEVGKSYGNNTELNKTENNIYSSSDDKQEIEKKSNRKATTVYTLQDKEEIWKAYPRKEGKADFMRKIDKILKTVSKEELLRAVNRYAEKVKDREQQFKYAGSTFFNGKYMDYLDINIADSEVCCTTTEPKKVELSPQALKAKQLAERLAKRNNA